MGRCGALTLVPVALAAAALAAGCSGDVIRVEWSDVRAVVAVDLDPDDRVLRVSTPTLTLGRAARVELDADTRTIVLGFPRALVDYGIDGDALGGVAPSALTAPLPPPVRALAQDAASGAIDLDPDEATVARATAAVRVPRPACPNLRPVRDTPLVELERRSSVTLALPYAPRAALVSTTVRDGEGAAFVLERIVGQERQLVQRSADVGFASGFAEPDGTVWLVGDPRRPSSPCRLARLAPQGPLTCLEPAPWVTRSVRLAGARWQGRLELWLLDVDGALSQAVELEPGRLSPWTTVRRPSDAGRCSLTRPALSVVGPGQVIVGRPGGALDRLTLERDAVREEPLFAPDVPIDTGCVAAYARLERGVEALVRVAVDPLDVDAVVPTEVRWRRGASGPWFALPRQDSVVDAAGLVTLGDQLIVSASDTRVVAPDPLRPDLEPVVCPPTDGVAGAVIAAEPWDDALLIVSANAFSSTVRVSWFELAR